LLLCIGIRPTADADCSGPGLADHAGRARKRLAQESLKMEHPRDGICPEGVPFVNGSWGNAKCPGTESICEI
jgi:hypothetical protein